MFFFQWDPYNILWLRLHTASPPIMNPNKKQNVFCFCNSTEGRIRNDFRKSIITSFRRKHTKTINNILEGKKIPIYSQGENIRDWIYVEDHCAGILGISYAGDVGQKYNIGGECEMTNLELVKMIIKLMNASEDLIEFVDDRPGHDLRYAIDNAKIYKTISFQPEINIEDGLKKTIDWYEKNRD